MLRECEERRASKFHDEDNDDKFQFQEKSEYNVRKFKQDENHNKFQQGQNRFCEQEPRESEGWRRRWSNEGDDGNKECVGSREGWRKQRNKEGAGNQESWSYQDKGALGFFLCPVCLATHLVPRLLLIISTVRYSTLHPIKIPSNKIPNYPIQSM